MSSKIARWALPALLVPALMVGCDDDPVTSGTTEVTVALTDVPGDIENVWVEITDIYLQGTGGRQPLVPEDFETTGLIELTELDDEVITVVDGIVVPSGTYGQLRLVVSSAVAETSDGMVYSLNGAEHPDPGAPAATGELVCPSCEQTGFKVLLQGEELTLEGGSVVMVLDWDVAQSFDARTAGNSGRLVMRPTVHGVDFAFGATLTGTVDMARNDAGVPLDTVPAECPAGTVTDGIEEFVPLADNGGETPTSGNVTADDADPAMGTFSFGFLMPDTYTLNYAPSVQMGETHELVFTATVDPAEVTLASSGSGAAAYVISSVECQEVSTGG